MTQKKILAAALASTLAMGVVGTADALTIYTKGYGGFVDLSWSTDPFPSAACEGGTFVNDGDTICQAISWGTAQGTGGPFGGKSGAIINDGIQDFTVLGENVFENGTLQTPLELLGTLTHINEPINEWWQVGQGGDSSSGIAEAKATVSVRYVLELYEDVGRTQLIDTLSSKLLGDFTVSFQETHNDGSCPAPNLAGSNCDDIFEFGPLTATAPFSFMGKEYVVGLQGFFSDPEFTNLTGTLYTGEETNTIGYVAEFKFLLVPEPGSMALLGLGLAVFGAARRRVRKG
jgi:hypothetical protein